LIASLRFILNRSATRWCK